MDRCRPWPPLPRIDPTFEVVVVGESADAVPTDAVVKLVPSHTFEDAPSPFAIVVPGGGQPTLAACGNQQLIDEPEHAYQQVGPNPSSDIADLRGRSHAHEAP